MKRLLALFLFVFPLSAWSQAQVAFSPDRGALELVIRTIDSAHSTIRVAAYTFTSKPIAGALMRARKRGVDVRVVVDRSNATPPIRPPHTLQIKESR
jgi:phosphatidylserine/phosphatidylglycerophosphate/cardiolipin synthase-like enzyme